MKKMINVAMVLVMVAMCATFFALGYIYPHTKVEEGNKGPKTEETTEVEPTDEEIVVDYFGEEGFKLLQHRIDDGHFALVTIYNVDGRGGEELRGLCPSLLFFLSLNIIFL